MSTVLVIEDNPDNMELVRQILEDQDYLMVEAGTARKGIELMHSGDIDLVLMDISLPEMDGLTATRLIRNDLIIRHIPIIALTAHAMLVDKEKALDSGCNAYLSKPFEEESLLQLIQEHIE